MSAFGQPLAGWWSRVAAYLLDVLILLIPLIIVIVLVTVVLSYAAPQTSAELLASFAALVVEGAYFSLLNGMGRGQTVGNMAMGIGLRHEETGSVVGPGRALLRWLVRVLLYVFVLPGLLNDLWPIWGRQKQTLADKACSTVMVRLR